MHQLHMLLSTKQDGTMVAKQRMRSEKEALRTISRYWHFCW